MQVQCANFTETEGRGTANAFGIAATPLQRTDQSQVARSEIQMRHASTMMNWRNMPCGAAECRASMGILAGVLVSQGWLGCMTWGARFSSGIVVKPGHERQRYLR